MMMHGQLNTLSVTLSYLFFSLENSLEFIIFWRIYMNPSFTRKFKRKFVLILFIQKRFMWTYNGWNQGNFGKIHEFFWIQHMLCHFSINFAYLRTLYTFPMCTYSRNLLPCNHTRNDCVIMIRRLESKAENGAKITFAIRSNVEWWWYSLVHGLFYILHILQRYAGCLASDIHN